MKTIVWAALQSLSTLEQVDRMLPDLIDETELKNSPGRYRYRRGLQKTSNRKSLTKVIGLALITIGIMMLIPGPVDLAFAAVGATIGGTLGGPVGAVIGGIVGVILYNVMALAMIAIGTWMLTW